MNKRIVLVPMLTLAIAACGQRYSTRTLPNLSDLKERAEKKQTDELGEELTSQTWLDFWNSLSPATRVAILAAGAVGAVSTMYYLAHLDKRNADLRAKLNEQILTLIKEERRDALLDLYRDKNFDKKAVNAEGMNYLALATLGGASPGLLNDLHMFGGVDINHVDPAGRTPLLMVKRADQFKWYLEQGANITTSKFVDPAHPEATLDPLLWLIRKPYNELPQGEKISIVKQIQAYAKEKMEGKFPFSNHPHTSELIEAIKLNDYLLAKELVEAGVPLRKLAHGTELHLIAKSGMTASEKQLLISQIVTKRVDVTREYLDFVESKDLKKYHELGQLKDEQGKVKEEWKVLEVPNPDAKYGSQLVTAERAVEMRREDAAKAKRAAERVKKVH